MYLWFKLLHIFFMISWFAGLFYLPRIYVNLAQVDPQAEPAEYQRLVCGIVIPFANGWWGFGWVHVKLLLGLLLLGYQHVCRAHLRRFCEHACRHSHKWYRVFNEIPVLMMVAALYLVVFKPF